VENGIYFATELHLERNGERSFQLGSTRNGDQHDKTPSALKYIECYSFMSAELSIKLIKNVKQSHNTPLEAQGERTYISYSFTTSALDGGEWSASLPA